MLDLMWAGLGRSGLALAGFAANLLLTRLMPPREVGLYFVVVSLVLIARPFASLSLRQPTIAAIAAANALGDRARAAAVARAALRMATWSGLGVAALCLAMWALLNGLGLNGGLDGADSGLLIALWIAVAGIQNQLIGTLQGLEDIRLAALFDFALAKIFAVVALGLIWAWRGQATLDLVLAVTIASELASTALAWMFVRRGLRALGPSAAPVSIAALWRDAWPFLLLNLTGIAAQADIVVLGLFRPAEQVALYGTASRVSGLVSLLGTIVTMPITPATARLHAQGRRGELQELLQGAITGPTVVAAIMAVLWMVAGGFVLETLFGVSYRDGALVLVILGVGQWLNLSFGLCMETLAMSGQQRVATTIAMIACVIKVAAILAVAYPFGPVGVATASVAVSTGAKLAAWWVTRRRLGVYTHASPGMVGKACRQAVALANAGLLRR